jgi:hypothetical protein
VWDNVVELLRDNVVVKCALTMRKSFAWILYVDNKEHSAWFEEEGKNLGYIFDGLEVVIGSGTLNEQAVNVSRCATTTVIDQIRTNSRL